MFLIISLLAPTTVTAANYQVASDGEWNLTQGKIEAGDRIIFSGNFSKTIVLTKSGTATNPIELVGQGAKVLTNDKVGIQISGSYVNLSGFRVEGAQSFGILVEGKWVKVENNIVAHNVVENGKDNNCLPSSAGVGWGSGLKIKVGAEEVVVRNNQVFENCGEGIAITRGVRVMVEGNMVRDNYSVNIYLDNSPFSEANNNQVSCTGIYLRDGRRMTGIAVAEESYSGWGAQRHDNKVVGNSVDGCYVGIAGWAAEVSGGKFINGIIENNIVTGGQNGSIVISSANENLRVVNNQVYTPIRLTNSGGVVAENNVVVGGGVSVKPTQSLTTTPTSRPSAVPTKYSSPIPTMARLNGDYNDDGLVDVVDYSVWYQEYFQGEQGRIVSNSWRADGSGPVGIKDGLVDIADFALWYREYWVAR